MRAGNSSICSNGTDRKRSNYIFCAAACANAESLDPQNHSWRWMHNTHSPTDVLSSKSFGWKRLTVLQTGQKNLCICIA